MILDRKTTSRAGWKRVLYAALGFVVVAFIYNFPGQVAAYRQKRDLEKTFRQYSLAIESRDYSTAYTFGTPAFKEAISPQVFEAQQRSFESQFGTLRSIRKGSLYMHGRGSPMQWIGLVEEDRDYDKGKLHMVCEFHLDEGRWQIFGCKQTD